MVILGKIRRLLNTFKYMKKIYQDGGISQINVASVNYNNILENKRIVITGAGSGIGLSIAKKCVDCGAQVLITGRSEEKLQLAVSEINNSRVKYVVWDVNNIDSISSKINECMYLLNGDIDILVNNAGAAPKEFFPEVTEKEWDRIYNTNSKAVFFISEYLCKHWMSKKSDYYRKIVNIDSQGGFVGATYPYRMSKWDVRGLTKGLGLKMAPYKVLVNGIAPGIVKTEMQNFSLSQGSNAYCSQNPLNRFSLPEEVAELAIFMMSDSCNFMVGQTVLIDGGFSLI